MTLLKDLEINPRTGKRKYSDPNNSPEIQKERNQRSNPINNAKNIYKDGKYLPRGHPLYKILKPGSYKNIDGLLSVTSESPSTKEGYIYAITNKAWPDWIKIGMAENPHKRLSQFNTADPYRSYELLHHVNVSHMRKYEDAAHKEAELVAKETNAEWFKIDKATAKNILDSLPKKLVVKKEQKKSVTQDLFTYAEAR